MRALFKKMSEIGLALLLCGPLFWLGIDSYPIADDFRSYNWVQTGGFRHYVHHMYFEWGGRIGVDAFLALWLRFCNPFQLRFLSSLLGLLLFFQSVLIVRILSEKEPDAVSRSFGRQILMTLMVLSAFWWGCRDILGETVFWASGGSNYLVPSFLGLVWIYFLPAALERSGKIAVICFSLFSVVIGTLHQQLAPALFIYGAGFQRLEKKPREWTWKSPSTLYGVGLALGALVLFFAPGNFVRARTLPASFQVPLSQYSAFYRYLFFRYWALGGWRLLQLSILAGGVMEALWPCRRLRWNFAYGLLFFACSAGTLVPMVFVPRHVENRTAWYFMLFLHMACVLWGRVGLALVRRRFSVLVKGIWINGAAAVVLGISLFLFLQSSYQDIYWARLLSMQLNARDRMLKTQAGSGDVVVPALWGRRPLRLHFNDLALDPASWINESQAEYYHVQSLRLSPGADIKN